MRERKQQQQQQQQQQNARSGISAMAHSHGRYYRGDRGLYPPLLGLEGT
jgi:hypothetical protein